MAGASELLQNIGSLPWLRNRVRAHDRKIFTNRHDDVRVIRGSVVRAKGIEDDDPVAEPRGKLAERSLRRARRPAGVCDSMAAIEHETAGPFEELVARLE